eukprot:5475302-Pleurochrysis_carterae.AAC.1
MRDGRDCLVCSVRVRVCIHRRLNTFAVWACTSTPIFTTNVGIGEYHFHLSKVTWCPSRTSAGALAVRAVQLLETHRGDGRKVPHPT